VSVPKYNMANASHERREAEEDEEGNEVEEVDAEAESSDSDLSDGDSSEAGNRRPGRSALLACVANKILVDCRRAYLGKLPLATGRAVEKLACGTVQCCSGRLLPRGIGAHRPA
jgi:hypothetical protein